MKLHLDRVFSALALAVGFTHAVMLGGVEVPKEKFIVYILIGHSNMSGENHPQADGVAAAHTWYYQWYKGKQWLPAKEPPNNPDLGLSGRNEGGPGMPFLKGMATAYPDYHFGVISNATVSCTIRGVNTGHNGSELPANQNRYWKGATLYQEIPGTVNPLKKDFTLGGIICMMGTVEATRTSDTVCSQFSDDVAQMVKDYRADLGEPNLPFIIGEYEAGATQEFALTMPWPKIINQQIKLIPSKLANSVTVNSVGIPMKDNHHYNILGEGEFAKRVIQAIKDKSWTPQASSILSAAGSSARTGLRGPLFMVGEGVVVFPGSDPGRLIRTDGRLLILR